MVGIEKNNKEQKSQGKKPHEPSKVSKLSKEAKENKPQPDKVPDGKKATPGKKILKVYKDHPIPDSLKKAYSSTLLNASLPSGGKNIPKLDKDDIVEKIDEIKLERSCVDFYVKTTKNKPLKIYLRIIKNSKTFLSFEILVKYISSINGEIIEKKLEFEHNIINHSQETAKSFLEKKIFTHYIEIMIPFIKQIEAITYPKILYNLNVFTYCKLMEQINLNTPSSNENLKYLKKLKKIAENWFSQNKYNIPSDNECLISLNLLNEADSERHKTSEAVKDVNRKTKKEVTDKQHKLRSKIKEKGREIKDRNTHFTITDIARNLKKQKPFEKYSVDTLRRYYPESYLYRGKIIK